MVDSDILTVTIRDSAYYPYFSDKAKIRDKRQMIRLLRRLEDNGVLIPSRQDMESYKEEWFDD